jgi:hypothetical protein
MGSRQQPSSGQPHAVVGVPVLLLPARHPVHCRSHAAPAAPAVPAVQEEWDEEQHPEGFELSGGLPAAQVEQPAAAAANGSGQAEPVPAAAVAPAGKAALQETDDGVVLLASDSEEEVVDATEAAAPGGSDVAATQDCPVCPVLPCVLLAGCGLPVCAHAEPLYVPRPRQARARASARQAGHLLGAREKPEARRRGWQWSLPPPPPRLARQWRRRMLSWTCSSLIKRRTISCRVPPCLHCFALHRPRRPGDVKRRQ